MRLLRPCRQGSGTRLLRRSNSHRRDQASNRTHPRNHRNFSRLTTSTEEGSSELEGSARALRLFIRAGSQIQCLPRRHEGLRGDERGVHRLPSPADAFAELPSGSRTGGRNSYRD